MIDITALRRDPEPLRAAMRARGGRYSGPLEELLAAAEDERKLRAEVEALRAERNRISQEIARLKASGREAPKPSFDKEDLAAKDSALAAAARRMKDLALGLPNAPHESVPPGKTPEDNKVARESPDAFPAPAFKVLDHQAVGEKLGILDFLAASRLSGSRFSLWRGRGAGLMRAIIAYQLGRHVAAGYEEIWPPSLVRPEILEGTGQLPKFEADLYKTSSTDSSDSSPLYLIPTAEVPLTNLVREGVLDEKGLPLKFCAYTPCFRQEAGSYGKDVRGLIRNHQFDKVELVWVTRPEDSLAALETLTSDAEGVLKGLGLRYRILELCKGDLGFASRKTYDLEVWMPAEGKFREISSCSDCGDFQARRMNARFRRGPKGPLEFVHTLNGSGVAVGRLFAAILENFQEPDGSVRVPEPLIPYAGFDRIPSAQAPRHGERRL